MTDDELKASLRDIDPVQFSDRAYVLLTARLIFRAELFEVTEAGSWTVAQWMVGAANCVRDAGAIWLADKLARLSEACSKHGVTWEEVRAGAKN